MRGLLLNIGVPEVLIPVATMLCERESDKNVAGFVSETKSSGLLILTFPKDGLEVERFYIYYLSTRGAELVEEAPVSLFSDLVVHLSLGFALRLEELREGASREEAVEEKERGNRKIENYNRKKRLQGGLP